MPKEASLRRVADSRRGHVMGGHGEAETSQLDHPVAKIGGKVTKAGVVKAVGGASCPVATQVPGEARLDAPEPLSSGVGERGQAVHALVDDQVLEVHEERLDLKGNRAVEQAGLEPGLVALRRLR